MIKHILDRVLNPEPPAALPLAVQMSSSEVHDGAVEPVYADFANLSNIADFPVFGAEMGNWFDSVDFGGSPWIDSGSFAMGECRSY